MDSVLNGEIKRGAVSTSDGSSVAGSPATLDFASGEGDNSCRSLHQSRSGTIDKRIGFLL